MKRHLDLEILLIPVAIGCALTFLVPRRVGLLGVVPVAVLAMLVTAVPITVRAFDPGRRSRQATYFGANLLASVAAVSVLWLLRSVILWLVPT